MGLPVAASRIVGRKSTGDADDLTSTEVLAILFPAGFDFEGYDGSSPALFRITAVDGQTDPAIEILRGDLSPAIELLVVTGSTPARPTESGMQLYDARFGPDPGDGAAMGVRL